MNDKPIKKYPTIGCCGIDCGLCPRYYTEGPSRCPGCCGSDFFNKHPTCGIITCCVKKKSLEVCGECEDFPCPKFNPWFGNNAYDSFVTHKKCEENLNSIKENGIEIFIKQQKKRAQLLEEMLKKFNDGRSKSFYCIATALLPINVLQDSIESTEKKIKTIGIKGNDFKNKAKILKTLIQEAADKANIDLKLRKPK